MFYKDINSVTLPDFALTKENLIANSTVPSLCGDWDRFFNNIPDERTLTGIWVWAIWVLPVVTISLCVGKMIVDGPSLPRHVRSRLQKISQVILVRRYSLPLATVFGMGYFACFGAQHYLFSIYFKHELVSLDLAFGQIIAVAVWVPCLVEFVYIKYRKSEKNPNSLLLLLRS